MGYFKDYHRGFMNHGNVNASPFVTVGEADGRDAAAQLANSGGGQLVYNPTNWPAVWKGLKVCGRAAAFLVLALPCSVGAATVLLAVRVSPTFSSLRLGFRQGYALMAQGALAYAAVAGAVAIAVFSTRVIERALTAFWLRWTGPETLLLEPVVALGLAAWQWLGLLAWTAAVAFGLRRARSGPPALLADVGLAWIASALALFAALLPVALALLNG